MDDLIMFKEKKKKKTNKKQLEINSRKYKNENFCYKYRTLPSELEAMYS